HPRHLHSFLHDALPILIAIHFWRIRKDGGLSRPEAKAQALPATFQKKIYGLQGFVRANFTKVGNVPDDSVYTWPHLLIAELFVLDRKSTRLNSSHSQIS